MRAYACNDVKDFARHSLINMQRWNQFRQSSIRYLIFFEYRLSTIYFFFFFFTFDIEQDKKKRKKEKVIYIIAQCWQIYEFVSILSMQKNKQSMSFLTQMIYCSSLVGSFVDDNDDDGSVCSFKGKSKWNEECIIHGIQFPTNVCQWKIGICFLCSS